MFKSLHDNNKLQLILGLLMGICFGFLLQKGGVTRYGVIMDQLLLKDFTVVKVFLTAAITGMVGIYFFRQMGIAKLHIKSGAFGSTVIGGLIFGVGFALLGYCPGTLTGAAGQGSMDALFGGAIGMLIGTSVYALLFPMLSKKILNKGSFGSITLPQLLKLNPWPVIAAVSLGILALFFGLEQAGL